MQYKIIQLFLIGLILCSVYSYKPPVETYLKPLEAPRTTLKHKKNVYVAPKGKALEIAKKVSNLTNVPCETISRIMYYESSYRENLVNVNKNGTKDYGLFQINSIWIKKAESMGLNIKDSDDNADFAIYLIKKNGLRDWSASKKNWQI